MTRGDNAATAGGLTSSDNSQVKKRARFHNPRPGIVTVALGEVGFPLSTFSSSRLTPQQEPPSHDPLPGSNNPLSPKGGEKKTRTEEID